MTAGRAARPRSRSARRRPVRASRRRRGGVLPGAARRPGRHPRVTSTIAVPSQRSGPRLYAWPTYEDPDSDAIVGGPLLRIDRHGRPVRWLVRRWRLHQVHPHHGIRGCAPVGDATGARLAAPAALAPEARFGLIGWPRRGTRDTGARPPGRHRVGRPSGTYIGDHDLWRLPEVDDALPGREPLPRAPPRLPRQRAGAPVPPNLAGRFAAAFGLAAQVTAHRSPAAEELATLRRSSTPRRHRTSPRPTWSPPCRTRSIPSPHGGTTWPGAPPSWRSRARRSATHAPMPGWPRRAIGRWVPRARGRPRHAQPLRHQRARVGRPRAGDAGGPSGPCRHRRGGAARGHRAQLARSVARAAEIRSARVSRTMSSMACRTPSA